MELIVLPLSLAVILGIVQYLSEYIYERSGEYYKHVISFSAGIAITYLFLDLFPNFSEQVRDTNKFLFLFLLIGFVAFHLIEKYIYQHSKGGLLKKRLGIENQVTSFVYHFILGIIIFDFSRQSIQETILLFIPIMIFTAVSTLPVSQHPSNKINFVVSLSTLLGVLFVGFIYTDMAIEAQTALLGIIIGGLFFSVIRHSIPMGKSGKPLFFTIGILVYTPIIVVSWFL